MIGLLLILSVGCFLNVEIAKYDTFSFRETYKKGDLIKIELKERENKLINFKLTNSSKATIFDGKYSQCTLFTTIEQDNYTLLFEFLNINFENITANFEVSVVNPDKDNSIDSENEIVADLRRNLEIIIATQRQHLQNEIQYEYMVRSSKRSMVFLLICECIFSIIIVFYLHRETVKLFENKRQI